MLVRPLLLLDFLVILVMPSIGFRVSRGELLEQEPSSPKRCSTTRSAGKRTSTILRLSSERTGSTMPTMRTFVTWQ